MPPERGADPGQYYRRTRGRLALAPTLEAMRRKYAPERARRPRKLAGTFTAPVDIAPEAFAKMRLEKVQRFVDAMQAQGWRLCTERRYPITLETGACPAYDLRDQASRDDLREYVVSAWFTFPDPKPLRIELPPWFTAVAPERS